MIRNAISRAFTVSLSAAAVMLGLASDLAAAPVVPPSMSSLMHLDHVADLRAMVAADANTIVLKNFHFAPMWLTVRAGTTVSWENLDGQSHTVVSMDGLFRSGGLDQNDIFPFTFDTPGAYKSSRPFRPQIVGTIIVK